MLTVTTPFGKEALDLGMGLTGFLTFIGDKIKNDFGRHVFAEARAIAKVLGHSRVNSLEAQGYYPIDISTQMLPRRSPTARPLSYSKVIFQMTIRKNRPEILNNWPQKR